MRGMLSVIWALLLGNMKGYRDDVRRLIVMASFMMIQNSIFLAVWIVFFQNVSEINGWRLQEAMRLFGLTASAVGLSLFFLNGTRTLAYGIQDGTLDKFITRPRATLPSLMLSASSPASLGDILYGPLLWLTLGGVGWAELPYFIAITLLSAILFTAATLMIYAIAFWLRGSPRFSDQMFEMLVIFSMNILHGQPIGVKALVFTAIPAGFISYVPSLLLQEFDPTLMGVLLAATVGYSALAVFIFRAGIARYVRSVDGA